MASIEEVRAGIRGANDHANSAVGATTQALDEADSARGMLMNATEGSGQNDVEQAVGQLSQAVDSLEESRQRLLAAVSLAEDVAARL